MEFPFKRPPWLRWQKPRASLWLDIYFVVAAIPVALIPTLIEQHRLGSDFKTAFQARLDLLWTTGPTAYDYLVSAAIVISLGWFTYFSKSERVTDGDKLTVFIMFCGSLGALIVSGIQHLAH